MTQGMRDGAIRIRYGGDQKRAEIKFTFFHFSPSSFPCLLFKHLKKSFFRKDSFSYELTLGIVKKLLIFT